MLFGRNSNKQVDATGAALRPSSGKRHDDLRSGSHGVAGRTSIPRMPSYRDFMPDLRLSSLLCAIDRVQPRGSNRGRQTRRHNRGPRPLKKP